MLAILKLEFTNELDGAEIYPKSLTLERTYQDALVQNRLADFSIPSKDPGAEWPPRSTLRMVLGESGSLCGYKRLFSKLHLVFSHFRSC